MSLGKIKCVMDLKVLEARGVCGVQRKPRGEDRRGWRGSREQQGQGQVTAGFYWGLRGKGQTALYWRAQMTWENSG